MNIGSFKPAGKLIGQINIKRLYMFIKFNIYSKSKGIVWGQVSRQSIFRLAEDYKEALYNEPRTENIFILDIMKEIKFFLPLL